jgi:hypothetical protein
MFFSGGPDPGAVVPVALVQSKDAVVDTLQQQVILPPNLGHPSKRGVPARTARG